MTDRTEPHTPAAAGGAAREGRKGMTKDGTA